MILGPLFFSFFFSMLAAMRFRTEETIQQVVGYFKLLTTDLQSLWCRWEFRRFWMHWSRLTDHFFTLSFKASPFCSWVCLGSSLTEHLSLWCHRWHSDDPGHPVWHGGYSPAMTSLRQTQYQTEHCCSSHYSSCRDREGFIWMETGFRLAF